MDIQGDEYHNNNSDQGQGRDLRLVYTHKHKFARARITKWHICRTQAVISQKLYFSASTWQYSVSVHRMFWNSACTLHCQ